MPTCLKCHARFAGHPAHCALCGAALVQSGWQSIGGEGPADALRPRATQLAIGLLFAVLLPNLALSVLLDAAPPSARTLASALLLTGFSAFLIYQLSRGRNWARSSYLVVFIYSSLDIPGLFGIVASGTAAQRVMGTIDLALSLLELVALIVLFTSPSNEWFRQRGPGEARDPAPASTLKPSRHLPPPPGSSPPPPA